MPTLEAPATELHIQPAAVPVAVEQDGSSRKTKKPGNYMSACIKKTRQPL